MSNIIVLGILDGVVVAKEMDGCLVQVRGGGERWISLPWDNSKYSPK